MSKVWRKQKAVFFFPVLDRLSGRNPSRSPEMWEMVHWSYAGMVHSWCTLFSGQMGTKAICISQMERLRRAVSVTLLGRENVQVEKWRGEFEMLRTSLQPLNPRLLKNGNWVQPKCLLIDIKYSLFSLSFLVIDPRKPSVCLSWMSCSTWTLACFQKMICHLQPAALQPPANAAGPGRPHRRALLPGDQGNTCHHIPCPFFCLHWERETYPAARNCGRCFTKARTLSPGGAGDGKRHPVQKTRTEKKLNRVWTLILLFHWISNPQGLEHWAWVCGHTFRFSWRDPTWMKTFQMTVIRRPGWELTAPGPAVEMVVPQFTDNTEAQRGGVICPKLHSWVSELWLRP